jgi:hypothetical protein
MIPIRITREGTRTRVAVDGPLDGTLTIDASTSGVLFTVDARIAQIAFGLSHHDAQMVARGILEAIDAGASGKGGA